MIFKLDIICWCKEILCRNLFLYNLYKESSNISSKFIIFAIQIEVILNPKRLFCEFFKFYNIPFYYYYK